MIGPAKQSKDACKYAFTQRTLKRASLCVICFLLILWPKSPKSEIIFLDVGQGDGIYIGSEDGTTFFIDGGSSDINQVGTYRILPFLKAHGVSDIDYWFVSHADTDHISGLLEVLEDGYEIGYVVLSEYMPEDENQELLLDAVRMRDVPVLFMKVGDQIVSENVRITCLYPWEEQIDRNEQSMVLILEYLDEMKSSNFKAVFSGDISSKGEAELIAKGILEDVDLYKAAHHGSKYSNSQDLLDVLKPEYCVISCGVDNSYGHPHGDVLERLQVLGCKIEITAETGQVLIEIPSKKKN